MATVEHIIQEIRDEIEDTGFSATRILRLINRGAELIAEGRFDYAPWKYCLPKLETSGTLTTSTTLSYVALSGMEDEDGNNGFQKNLFSCYSEDTDRKVKILNSIDHLTKVDNALDGAGSVRWVAVSGDYLYYQDIPSTADTLTLRYYKKPDVMDFGDEPSWLDTSLQVDLLKSYCLSKMYKKKGFDRRIAQEYEDEFKSHIITLARQVGPYRRTPIRFTDSISEYLDGIC